MVATPHDVNDVSEGQLRKILELQRMLLAVVAGREGGVGRLKEVCSLFESAVPGLVASVMRLDAQSGLVFACAPNVPDAARSELSGVKPGPEAGSCAAAAWTGDPVFVGDVMTDPHWASVRGVASRHGIRACWSAPVRDRGERVVGTFALTSFESQLPDAFQRQLMTLGAAVVGLIFDQERDREHRSRADAELERLALVASKTPNAVIFVDRGGHIEWINDALRALSGTGDAALVGKRLDAIMTGPDTDPSALSSMLEAIAAGRDFATTQTMYRNDGHVFTIQLTCTPRFDSDGQCSGAVVMEVDVTALKRLSEFNALLAAVSDVIATEDDPDALLQSVCELAVHHAGLLLAWVGAPAEDGWFRFRAAAGPGIGYLDGLRISGDASSPLGRGPSGRTWREQRSYYNRAFAHMESLKPWQERAARYGFAASATLPIRRGGEMWAVLTVYHGQLGSFDPALQAQLETLATNISRGLDRIDLMRRERDIQLLNQSMLDSATVGVLLTRQHVIMHANQQAAHILGAADAAALEGVHVATLYPSPDESESVLARARAQFALRGRAVLVTPARRLDGREIWLRIDGGLFPREDYDQIWSLVDITEQHMAVEGQELLANALASVQEGVIVADQQQRIVYVNKAFEHLTGYTLKEMQGRSCGVLQGPDTEPATKARIRECLHHEQAFEGEILNYRKSGEPFWNQLTINPLRDGAGQLTHFVGVQRDVTDVHALNARLEHQAFHDELTDLPNRRWLDRHLARLLPETGRQGTGVALGMIDLDDFKIVNDAYGHALGDRLLMEVKQRMVARLATRDALVRVGGDEFVVVFAHLPLDEGTRHELERRIESLGRAFDAPFDIGNGEQVEMGVSMGIALYPVDAGEGGLLLRLADETLFQAKQHKQARVRWWMLHGDRPDLEHVVEQTVDPYGAEADRLLERSAAHFERVLEGFIERFYGGLADEPHARWLLDHLDGAELEGLKRRQASHLRSLVSPGILRESVVSNSRQLGRIHALTGVDSVLLVRWMAVYRDMMGTYFNAQPISARHRYRLVRLVEQRLQDDVQAQLEEQASTLAAFMHAVTRSPPEQGGNWNDALAGELEALSALPGVACVLALRPDMQERFSIELSAGSHGAAVLSALRGRQGGDGSSSLVPPAESMLMRAWRKGSVETLPSLATVDPSLVAIDLTREWLDMGMRAAAYIPILDEQGMSVALMILMGHYPNQFDGATMRQFTRGLQVRWSDLWQRSSRPPLPVDHETAMAYRERLFGGGLRMYLQPVIDLHDGSVMRFEALARLQLDDGPVLRPDAFLPVLRHADLDALFRLGLDAALAAVVELEAAGVVVGVALNIAPRTLAEPDCAHWVAEALGRHGLEPSRLTLEILESQHADIQTRDLGVQRMLQLGIKLAMDDLGSGYSSLRRLASVPFSAIKVDQDLLARIRVEPVPTISLIRAVVQMGGDFGCDVVVEGLEDAGKLEVARLLGAQMGQGFGIAEPMDTASALAWTRDYRARGFPEDFHTPLGALAFQWLSLRQGSLHPPALDACPMTAFLERSGCGGGAASEAHARMHEDPGDELAGQRLMDALEACVRHSHGDTAGSVGT